MTPQPHHRAAHVALGGWVATMLVVAAALLLPVVSGAPSGVDRFENWPTVLLAAVPNATLGAVIVAWRPHHPIGWLLAGSGATMALQLLTGQYAALGPGVAGAAVAAWVALRLQVVGVVSLVVLFQLFPTGRPISPRWWVLVWAAIAAVALQAVSSGLRPARWTWTRPTATRSASRAWTRRWMSPAPSRA